MQRKIIRILFFVPFLIIAGVVVFGRFWGGTKPQQKPSIHFSQSEVVQPARIMTEVERCAEALDGIGEYNNDQHGILKFTIDQTPENVKKDVNFWIIAVNLNPSVRLYVPPEFVEFLPSP